MGDLRTNVVPTMHEHISNVWEDFLKTRIQMDLWRQRLDESLSMSESFDVLMYEVGYAYGTSTVETFCWENVWNPYECLVINPDRI